MVNPEEVYSTKQADIIENNNELEVDKTRRAIAEVSIHEFRFGYEYGFEQDKVGFSWNADRSLSITITPCRPEDSIWFGNCYDDALVSRAFLKSKVGEGAKVSVQRLKADNFIGGVKDLIHYRLLVEHHGTNKTNSVLTEIDHSPFYRKTASGENQSITSWVETDHIAEGVREVTQRNADSFLPMCEYVIDGTARILCFKFEIEKEAIYIRMNQVDSTDDEPKPDALRYPIYFYQLDNLPVVLNDIKNHPAFRPNGPFKDQMSQTTLDHMQRGLQLVVSKIPPVPK